MSNQQDPSLHPLRQPATPEQERRVREILEGQGITLEHWLCEPGAVLTVGDALAVIDHAEAGEEIARVEGAPTVIDIDDRAAGLVDGQPPAPAPEQAVRLCHHLDRMRDDEDAVFSDYRPASAAEFVEGILQLVAVMHIAGEYGRLDKGPLNSLPPQSPGRLIHAVLETATAMGVPFCCDQAENNVGFEVAVHFDQNYPTLADRAAAAAAGELFIKPYDEPVHYLVPQEEGGAFGISFDAIGGAVAGFVGCDDRDAIANETLARAGLDAALLRLNRAMADFSDALRDVIESGAATHKREG